MEVLITFEFVNVILIYFLIPKFIEREIKTKHGHHPILIELGVLNIELDIFF